MKPPEAPQSIIADAGAKPPAVSVRLNDGNLQVMQVRAQYLACNNKRRQGTKAFLLQARNRNDDDPTINVGFTCSKKVGNAVARNRAKRRLREIARLILPQHGKSGWDYVLIGRKDVTATRDFTQMQSDLTWALSKVHG
ncbi:ribonuclease P protein component [Amylibacter sp. IMCC11727]|uniref:ribonuclease P protein component n=1 Tax=Amylibacter sp. IMCC11727 TaxID=3039851 RepID=UPI00244DEB06|nr:ribonuclease P protein component [Amylibacter sp. IMCC11727]WGI21687.1 ribonuclease P protein component [Amylibacter sp. IMCC11727]